VASAKHTQRYESYRYANTGLGKGLLTYLYCKTYDGN